MSKIESPPTNLTHVWLDEDEAMIIVRFYTERPNYWNQEDPGQDIPQNLINRYNSLKGELFAVQRKIKYGDLFDLEKREWRLKP